MEQIFIKIRTTTGIWIDRDIRETTVKQRLAFFKTLTRENMYILVENLWRDANN